MSTGRAANSHSAARNPSPCQQDRHPTHSVGGSSSPAAATPRTRRAGVACLIAIALALIALVAANPASAAVVTGHGGVGSSAVSCSPTAHQVRVGTQVTIDSDYYVETMSYAVDIERWNGRAWVDYINWFSPSHYAGIGNYPVAFNVAHGYYYRVWLTYSWGRTPTPVSGVELIAHYTVNGATWNGYCTA